MPRFRGIAFVCARSALQSRVAKAIKNGTEITSLHPGNFFRPIPQGVRVFLSYGWVIALGLAFHAPESAVTAR
jgi:hypothetical protein